MRDRNAPLNADAADALAWEKMDGLLPAIVQDVHSRQVLMLGYMNRDAFEASFGSGYVTFYSRSKNRLWQKGETSGNGLRLVQLFADCDSDALLVHAEPEGPTCHLGTTSCFGEAGREGVLFLERLAAIVHDRASSDDGASYTAKLLADGPVRIAQKVGEEGVEVALAAATGDREGCIEETADLIYHLTVLMEARGFSWQDVAARLAARHAVKS
jgi:phosphoribosyl-ATP pyrophosphohydrolase/phosphoribosyl-AMP cyclohydrolase